MVSRLNLAPLVRHGAQTSFGAHKSQRHFLDFVVDGQSLWDTLGKRHDLVSVLCLEFASQENARAIARLLLKEESDLANDRRSLFICSECGDLGCGAISLFVHRDAETITWEAFGYENTYEDKVLLEDYSSVGPFTFNKAIYEQTLANADELLKGITTTN